jgi:hypothetical protein
MLKTKINNAPSELSLRIAQEGLLSFSVEGLKDLKKLYSQTPCEKLEKSIKFIEENIQESLNSTP